MFEFFGVKQSEAKLVELERQLSMSHWTDGHLACVEGIRAKKILNINIVKSTAAKNETFLYLV